MESVPQRNDKRSRLDAPLVAANDGLLPTGVLQDVLLRLPADVLCRFRLVCRSWRSLTSDPIFAKAHSSRHLLVVGLRNNVGRRRWQRDHHQVQLLDPLSGNIVKRIRMRQGNWVDRDLSTDNGLLCLCERDVQEQACVLNPATCAITTLPITSLVSAHEKKRMSNWSTCVLGQVPSSGEYKALLIQRYENWRLDVKPLERLEPEQTYHVTTLGGADGSRDVRWRVKPCPPVRVAVSSTVRAVVKGVAYFLLDVDPTESDDIAALDLATEEWRRPMLRGPLSSHSISLPKNGEERVSFRLANLDGCLVSICHYTRGYLNIDCTVDLWFLMDIEKELWTKRYSLRSAPIGHPDGLYNPLAILGDGRILVWVLRARKIRAYDSKTRTWADLSTVESIYDVVMYQGSLLCSDIVDS